MLGIGLHSYGFMDEAFFWLMAFDVSQVALILLAFLPSRFWASFKTEAPGSSQVEAPAAVHAAMGG